MPLLSYWSSWNFARNPRQIIIEGYKKFNGAAFKVSLWNEWLVILGDPKLAEELHRRSDEELSQEEAFEDVMQLKYTLGRGFRADRYHVDLIRDKLTRSLPVLLPEVVDELSVAVPTYIPNGDGWASVKVLRTMRNIVARASNRIFVGVPLCRNQEYLDIAIRFVGDVISDRDFVNMFPPFMKSFVAYMSSRVLRNIDRAVVLFKPTLNERRAKLEDLGEDYPDQPKDFLQWILQVAVPKKESDESIVKRILLTNFGAIESSSNSITNALFDLATSPEHIEPLREEIDGIISTEGWTKASMGKMWKLDSFLKESQRFHGFGLTSQTRKAMRDVTLSDGTIIPAGTHVTAATYAIHRDDANYSLPDVFDPFRFARLRKGEGESTKHQFVNTSMTFLAFGHGRHACPGRFFAASQLKAIFAYIVLNYDMKLAGECRPQDTVVGAIILPDPHGEILFRKRKVVE